MDYINLNLYLGRLLNLTAKKYLLLDLENTLDLVQIKLDLGVNGTSVKHRVCHLTAVKTGPSSPIFTESSLVTPRPSPCFDWP